MKSSTQRICVLLYRRSYAKELVLAQLANEVLQAVPSADYIEIRAVELELEKEDS